MPDPEPSVGMNIAQIGTIAVGCFDLSNAGVTFIVPQAFPATPIMNIVSQGSGGASPFYYDVVELTVAGGTMPYHFAWDNEGYIRYDIAYEQVDTNGDGTPDTPGATITIMTADNATWNLLVSDAFGCTAAGTQFSNDPNGINDMLDIVNYVVSADNGTSTGSVNITAAGGGAGCAPYSYAWSGPDGFTATTEDLSDVPFGWYTVTVTCADGSQNTIGWYWVPITHRGRTKTEGMTEGIATYPNPVQSEAIVEFYVQTTGKTTLTVFAADGKQVSVLFDGIAEADLVYELPFSATHLVPGMYTVVMNTAAGSVQHSKVVVTK
ncbi:MAG: T9SS type A sorting domain-containing protein [Sphingobacteriales bacterium]|nr:T9SS type A sorting domain-containing protein [Sphingobacteriales bacterium]